VTYWLFNVEYGYKMGLIFFVYIYPNKTHILVIPSEYRYGYGYSFTTPDGYGYEYEYGHRY